MAFQIYQICVHNIILLDIQWISRNKNVLADGISKSIDYDDWGVSEDFFFFFFFFFFQFIDNMWGPHEVDRFANHENAKLKRFNSMVWNSGTEQVDAFTQNWAGVNNWLVPPIYLVIRTIRHLAFCRAEGTLIVSSWESSQFWPFLFEKESFCFSYIADILEFLPSQNIFIKCCNKKAFFGSNSFKK